LKRQISTWQNEGKKKEKRKKPKNLRKYYGGCLDAPAGNFPIVTARSLVKIGNRDGMCLARSIVTCLSHTINGNNTKFQQMKNNTFNCQTRAAVRLLQFAKLPGGRESYSIKDAAKIQKTLQKLYPRQYRIVIFDGQQHNRIIYKGEPAKHNLPIILFKHHFQPILHPKDLFKVLGGGNVDSMDSLVSINKFRIGANIASIVNALSGHITTQKSAKRLVGYVTVSDWISLAKMMVVPQKNVPNVVLSFRIEIALLNI
jgi:hypothetical protein